MRPPSWNITRRSKPGSTNRTRATRSIGSSCELLGEFQLLLRRILFVAFGLHHVFNLRDAGFEVRLGFARRVSQLLAENHVHLQQANPALGRVAGLDRKLYAFAIRCKFLVVPVAVE